jgi:hypothetical protein
MSILDDIVDNDPESEFLKADGFDDAVIGSDYNSNRLIYSVKLCMEILITNDGMDESEALEYLEFNTLTAYVGENTPIWCNDLNT